MTNVIPFPRRHAAAVRCASAVFNAHPHLVDKSQDKPKRRKRKPRKRVDWSFLGPNAPVIDLDYYTHEPLTPLK